MEPPLPTGSQERRLESPRHHPATGPLRLVTESGEGSLAAGTALGPYVVEGLLGIGGMGEVYRAFDPRLSRHVAIKILRLRLAEDAELRLRFERETRMLSALAHKNICTVFDTGVHAGQTFIVMELLEGRTLEDVLHGGPLPLPTLLDVAVQVADALRSAHEEGLVHRDVKSANIFLTSRGDAKVLDFGIAKSHADATSGRASDAVTRDGMVVGTVAFMSPEQARGEVVDARSDLFSFGIVLYQMATGSVPYAGNAISVLARIATPVPAPRIGDVNASLPAELDRIVARAMEKEPAARYPSATEMLDDLRRLRSEVASGAVKPVGGAPRRGAGSLTGRRRHVAIAIAIAVAATGLVAWPLLQGGSALRSLLVQECQTASGSASVVYQCRVIASNITAALDSVPGLTLRFRDAASPEERRDAQLAGRRARTDAVLTTQLDSSALGWHARALLTASRTGDVLWSGSYPVSEAEAPLLPGRIAGDVTTAVLERTAGATQVGAAQARPRMQLSLRQAEYQTGLRTTEGLERAVGIYQTVLSRDSMQAVAWAGLAMARLLQPYYSAVEPNAAYENAIAAARRALALDDGIGDAHAALGLALRDYHWDWSGAEVELRTAVALDSSSAIALQWYAELLHMTGRSDMAEPLVRAAVRLQPLELTPRAVHGFILLSTGRRREAVEVLQATLEMNPEHHLSHYFLGAALLQAGNAEGAVTEMRKAVELAPQARFYRAGLGHVLATAGGRAEAQRILAELRQGAPTDVSPYDVAILLTGLGDADGALRELQRAVDERRREAVDIKVNPLLSPLRGDPRFQSLVRRAGLPADP